MDPRPTDVICPQLVRHFPGFGKAVQADVGVQLTTIRGLGVCPQANRFLRLVQSVFVFPAVNVDEAQLVVVDPVLREIARSLFPGVDFFVHFASGAKVIRSDFSPLVLGSPIDQSESFFRIFGTAHHVAGHFVPNAHPVIRGSEVRIDFRGTLEEPDCGERMALAQLVPPRRVALKSFQR